MATNEELAAALRNVIDEAKRYYSFNGGVDEHNSLMDSVAALNALTEEANAPYGFVLNRAWEEVHVGWFVKTPKGDWIEVVGNEEASGGEKRNVTLLVNGKRASFMYDAARNVSIRKGSRTKAMDEAIELLGNTFGGATVIQDWS